MNDIEVIRNAILKFRDDRDWKQFHNSKDLSLAISIEAAELNQLFLWKKSEEVSAEKIKEELADIFTYSFLLAAENNIDIKQIILDKLENSSIKYPVDKAKGSAKKYNEL